MPPSPVPPPIALTTTTALGDPCSDDDACVYRAMVGALHYLTFTRLDIAYSVGKLSQHMHAPYSSHLVTAKRVLRYIKGSLDSAILFKKAASPTDASCLTAYFDSDWAGDPSDRRSTTGFVVFLGCNPISWAAKKQSNCLSKLHGS